MSAAALGRRRLAFDPENVVRGKFAEPPRVRVGDRRRAPQRVDRHDVPDETRLLRRKGEAPLAVRAQIDLPRVRGGVGVIPGPVPDLDRLVDPVREETLDGPGGPLEEDHRALRDVVAVLVLYRQRTPEEVDVELPGYPARGEDPVRYVLKDHHPAPAPAVLCTKLRAVLRYFFPNMESLDSRYFGPDPGSLQLTTIPHCSFPWSISWTAAAYSMLKPHWSSQSSGPFSTASRCQLPRRSPDFLGVLGSTVFESWSISAAA